MNEDAAGLFATFEPVYQTTQRHTQEQRNCEKSFMEKPISFIM
jgi:hypothetical protein